MKKTSNFPPDVQLQLSRLLQEVAARDGVLPIGMLDDLRAISVEGVDPGWQLQKLRGIMDRWLRAH